MGFGELVLVIVVAVVVIGPKDLPKVLRTLGQWAGKLRRMALDLRVQSGIDDVLKNEGLADDIQEIRKLARGELDGIRQAATIDLGTAGAAVSSATSDGAYPDITMAALRHREYPREGADSYNAMPDTAIVYVDALTKSALARDPLYVTGDANAVLPPEPEPAAPVATPAMPMGVPASELNEAPKTDTNIATQIGMPAPNPRQS